MKLFGAKLFILLLCISSWSSTEDVPAENPLLGDKSGSTEATRREFPTADMLFFRLDQVPETMHEEVEIYAKYIKTIDDLRHSENKTRDQSNQYDDMISNAKLEKLLAQATMTEKMYLEDPDEGGKSRQSDLVSIKSSIEKIIKYLIVNKIKTNKD